MTATSLYTKILNDHVVPQSIRRKLSLPIRHGYVCVCLRQSTRCVDIIDTEELRWKSKK